MEICSECNKRPVFYKTSNLCKVCYARPFIRAWNKRKQTERIPNGNICLCGCGQLCYRGHDKALPGHRRLCACGCRQVVENVKAISIIGHINWKRGKTGFKASEETKAKMSQQHKGKAKSPAHRLAISRAHRKSDKTEKERHDLIRRWAVYKEWRKAVFERDNYTCQICGSRNGNGESVYLEADHIIPFSIRPDLILVVSNGRTLCRICHRKTLTWGGNVKKMRGYKQRIVMQLPLEIVVS